MARNRRHIERGFEIPWHVAATVVRERNVPAFDAWRKIRLACGPSFTKIPAGIDPRQVKKLLALGWLRRDSKTGRYYQVKIAGMFQFTEGQYKVFHPARWAALDCKAVLHHIVQCYFTRFHKAAATPKQEVSKLNPRNARHLGGMALTQAMEIMGVSLGTAHNMRRRSEDAGLCKYEQRYEIRRYDAAQEAWLDGYGGHVFNARYGTLERLTSKLHVIDQVDFRICRRGAGKRHDAKPGFDYRAECNFVTGGAYAC
jgi:hypothetical protein